MKPPRVKKATKVDEFLEGFNVVLDTDDTYRLDGNFKLDEKQSSPKDKYFVFNTDNFFLRIKLKEKTFEVAASVTFPEYFDGIHCANFRFDEMEEGLSIKEFGYDFGKEFAERVVSGLGNLHQGESAEIINAMVRKVAASRLRRKKITQDQDSRSDYLCRINGRYTFDAIHN